MTSAFRDAADPHPGCLPNGQIIAGPVRLNGVVLHPGLTIGDDIGMVTQDNSPLHCSGGDSRGYGCPDAMDVQITSPPRVWPSLGISRRRWSTVGGAGLAANIRERGLTRAGGQRQQIAIARVLLNDAPVLILDAATMALDRDAEAAIQQQFIRPMRGKTVIASACPASRRWIGWR